VQKLLAGIAEFQRRLRPADRENFARLALGQAPDCLFIACSDSRVVPNAFASTDPGDLFVVRNVGNIVPPTGESGLSVADLSEAAAIEFALLALDVRDIVVCGHSECGAMHAMLDVPVPPGARNLDAWLAVGRSALARFRANPDFAAGLAPHNRLSQLNVLQQLSNLRTYPVVRERIDAGTLRLHGWWFDIAQARVHAYDADVGAFAPIVS
jgi:carbonic anhydrase